MRALICAASLLTVVVIVSSSSTPASARDEEKAPTIKQIMSKVHKGRKSLFATTKAQLKTNAPDWEKVEAAAVLIDRYGSSMPKNKAPRGNQASFEKLARAYAKNAKALKEAAEEKDLAETRAVMKKFGGSCQACHKAHRPRR